MPIGFCIALAAVVVAPRVTENNDNIGFQKMLSLTEFNNISVTAVCISFEVDRGVLPRNTSSIILAPSQKVYVNISRALGSESPINIREIFAEYSFAFHRAWLRGFRDEFRYTQAVPLFSPWQFCNRCLERRCRTIIRSVPSSVDRLP